ncbi:MAG: molybdate ABC transporter substrate-binding protein [Sulfurovum sp.]|nr:MAG: molybdate ABC transporter substrate-binding protein [Sulfurovum sp.]
MKRYMLFFVWSFMTLNAVEITVAVSTNVSYAIEPLKKAFKEVNPDTTVNVVLGSSGKLTAQIRHGAPFDLFMSANMVYPNVLYKEKLAVSKPVVYAQGSLALLSVKGRNYSNKIYVLKDMDIQKIAIANPKTAPYGVAAMEVIKNAKLYEVLKDKLVYGESVSQTVAYTTTAADIGIIVMSSLFSPQMSHFKEAIHWSEIDEGLYTPIDQGIVILMHGEGITEVKAFYDFILGNKAKEILKSFGYKVL